MSSGSSRLLREGGLKSASTAIVGLLGLLSSVFMARGLSETELGLFVLVLGMVQVGCMLSDGGSSLAVTRYIAAATSREEQRRLVRLGLRTRALISGCTIAIFLAASPGLQRYLFHHSLATATFIWCLVWITSKSIFLFAPAVLRGRRQWRMEGSLLVLEAVGLVAIYASISLGGGGGLSILPMRLSFFYIGLIGIAVIALRSGSRLSSAANRAFEKYSSLGMRRLLAFGLPLMINSSLFLGLTWTDRILLGVMRSREELAFYFVAVSLSVAGRMVFSVPEQVIYSHLAQKYRRDSSDLAAVYRELLFLFSILAMLTLVAGSAAGRLLIPRLYGPLYVASIWPFQLLMAVLLVRLISIPSSLLLVVVFERTHETSIALSLAFAVNLGLNLLLIPVHGILGAIEASCAGFAIATGYMWLALWKVSGLRIGSGQLLLMLTVSVLWFASTFAERQGRLAGQFYWILQVLLCTGLCISAWNRWRSPVMARLRGAQP